jgi:acetyltransferase-like isoleucine patch superfamily enzyme
MLKKLRTLNLILLGTLHIVQAEIIYFLFGQWALSNYIRKLSNPALLLKYLGVKIGAGTIIWPGITINCENRKKYKHLIIGNHARILWDVIIDLNDDVIIEDYAHVGARSSIITHYSLGDTPLGKTEYPEEKGSIIIGKGSAIAWNCIILHESKIGEHTIISVGSVVKGEVPSFCVFGGNPGRPIKQIIPQNMEDFK